MEQQLEELLQKLGAAQLWQKLAGLLGLIVLVTAGYWYFFLDDIWTQRATLEAETAKLEKEKVEYEGRKKEYLKYRAEVTQLQEEQKDVLRLLPRKDDIEQFVEALQQQTEMAGLNRQTLIRDPPLSQDLYIRLPIKMSLFGSYHQFMRFFKSLGEISRIVNVEDLRLAPVAQGDASKEVADLLRADFIAVAFQFLDRSAKKATGPTGGTMKSIAQSSGEGGK